VNWPIVKLEEVVSIRTGGVNPGNNPSVKYELYSIPGFDNGAPEQLVGAKIKSNKTIVHPGDVLFSKLNPRIPRIWIVSQPLQEDLQQISSTEFWPLICKSGLISRHFLKHLLSFSAFRSRFIGVTEAATKSRSRIKPFQLLQQQIQLPTLTEQNRIVEILNQAEALTKLRTEADEKAERILPTLYYNMFEDPLKNPNKLPVEPLENLVRIGTRLVDPNGSKFRNLPHIGGEHIEKRTGKILPFELVKDSQLKSNKFHFQGFHILYSKIRPYLNKVAFPQFEGVCSADIYPLEVIDNRISPRYLISLLRSDAFLAYAKIHSERLRMPKLNQDQLGSYPVPIPSRSSLEAFDRYSEELTLTDLHREKSRKMITTLFSQLMYKAFNGNLTQAWREAHMKEILQEMETQTKYLGGN